MRFQLVMLSTTLAVLAFLGGPMAHATEPAPVEVRAEIVSLKRTLDEHWGFGHHISYQVRFSRSDVTETTPDSGLSSDFPKGLQPKLLYISVDGANRTMCDRPRFPHACELPVEEGVPEPTHVTLEVTFEDGLEKTLELDVPRVPSWGRPKIESVSQEDGYTLIFEDAGALKYTAILTFFRGGPGNPFEDYVLAELTRENPGADLVLEVKKGGLPRFDVQLEMQETRVILNAKKHVNSDWETPGPLELAAVCGEGLWPAGEGRPETWLRECDIHKLAK